jgi:hypothetical protein
VGGAAELGSECEFVEKSGGGERGIAERVAIVSRKVEVVGE